MISRSKLFYAAVAVALCAAEGSARSADERKAMAEAVVGGWCELSALTARPLIERYGAPDDIGPRYLAWNHAGPWKRTVVRDLGIPYIVTDDAGVAEDAGVLEQTIEYPLTAAQADALAAFSPRLTIDMERGKLSVRSDREESNYLSLNLSDDIVRGRKTVAEAAAEYEKLQALRFSGKSSPYLERLVFTPVR